LSVLWYTAFNIWDFFSPDPGALSRGQVVFTFWIVSLLVGGAGLCAAFKLCPSAYKTPLALAIVTAFALFFFIDAPSSGRVVDNLPRALLFSISSPRHFNIFSFEARGIFALLALSLFILRWSGRTAASYWLLFALLLVHRTNAALLLGMLVCIDFFVAPQVLKRKVIFVPILVAIAYIAFTEPLIGVAGIPVILGLLCIMAVCLTIGHFGWKMLLLNTVQPILPKTPFEKNAALDIAFFSIGWLVTILAVQLAWKLEFFDWESGRFAWFQLHTRVSAIMLCVAVFATICILYGNYPRLYRYYKIALGLMIIICAGITTFILAENQWNPAILTIGINKSGDFPTRYDRLGELLDRLPGEAQEWTAHRKEPKDNIEIVWYYGLIRTMQGDDGYFPLPENYKR
jgi:hypothetical protein